MATTRTPTRYVALLRGINVGKARQVDMPRLKEVLTARGHDDVRTHLRSGNVVLTSALREAALAADLSAAIEAEFGFAVPVVVRSGTELAAVVTGDPFATVATDPARYLVTFLPEAPDPARVDALPPAEGGGDYLVRGRELYLWLPDGISETPLASWKWDRLLGQPGHRPELEHRPEAGRAERVRPGRAPPIGVTHVAVRFGRAVEQPIRSCSACTDEGREPARGPARDRAGGRADLAVCVTPSRHSRCSPGACRTSPSCPRVRADLRGTRRPPPGPTHGPAPTCATS